MINIEEFILTPFVDNELDFSHYYQLVGNAAVMAMITERALPADEARADYAKLLHINGKHPQFGNFKILDRDSGAFIGLGKLEFGEEQADAAELGYIIIPERQGQGIAGKIAKGLIAYAREQTEVSKLFAIIDPNNMPSRKILLNNGFVSIEVLLMDGLPGEILELTL